jgi:hypothetical protein
MADLQLNRDRALEQAQALLAAAAATTQNAKK